MNKRFIAYLAILLGLSPASITVLASGITQDIGIQIFIGAAGLIVLGLLAWILWIDLNRIQELRSALEWQKAQNLHLLTIVEFQGGSDPEENEHGLDDALPDGHKSAP